MIELGYPIDRIIDNGMRAALVVAHPGHELCLYGWLKLARPTVFVLTDGSGHSTSSRIQRTTEVVNELGAAIGPIYGRFSDAAIYQALLNQQFDLFISLAHELADEFIHERINYVVGDAIEGYNPTHDACRLVIDAAVEIARRKDGKPIKSFEFLMPGRSDPMHIQARAQPVCVELDDTVFERKLNAARSYLELKDEIDAVFNLCSEKSLRSEFMYPLNGNDQGVVSNQIGMYYEEHGELRVKQGRYDQVIRYEEHVLPLAMSLNRAAKESS